MHFRVRTMNFDVFATQVLSCEWNNNLILKGKRSYDTPLITFYKAKLVEGIWNIAGRELLCIERLEKGKYKLQYRYTNEVTILMADSYEAIINN